MPLTSNALNTFWVISSVKLKKLDRVVWETINVDPIFQDNDDSSHTRTGNEMLNTNSICN